MNPSRIPSRNLSTILTVLLAVLALAGGWLLKSAAASQTQLYQRGGVSAALPARWSINNGFSGEELIFTANPPLDFNLSYQVRLLPVVPAGKMTDLVVARNLAQGQSLTYYRVSRQQAVQVGARSGYQVDYSYIKTSALADVPVVIAGRDIYLDGPEKALLVTVENEAAHFSESLPGFMGFLPTVNFQKGAAQ